MRYKIDKLPGSIKHLFLDTCKRQKLNQRTLAAKLNIGQSTLSKWQNGRSPTLESLIKAVEHLGGEIWVEIPDKNSENDNK